MKRRLITILISLLMIGCAASSREFFQGSKFSAKLPEGFEPVNQCELLCFAPYGDPLLSSTITFYTTELNWYFDRFTESDYQKALSEQCGYEDLVVESVLDCKVDGCQAKRIECSVKLDQGAQTLVVYAVNTDQIYIFTLLNRDTDEYVDAFDNMMETIRLKGNK